jgi:hypothetical protein
MFPSSILHLLRQAETLPRPASRLWNPGFRFTAQFRPANCLPHIGFAKLGSSAKNTDNGWERINSFGTQGRNTTMSYQPIENYGIIGNMRTVALVGMNGSID